jgi:oligopeptide/dipeptide ABC transporter ATP-binding protein
VVITIEAGLSFLGVGVKPPTPSWGSILNDGYAYIRNTPWIVLFGGMLQRITIAMALMANPKLLIADEPTTALDATLEVQVVQLLKKLQQSYQCSMLFISHHLNVIAELSQIVVVMYAGEIVEQGTVRGIFHRAAHPYTKALLECDPSIIKEKTRHLPTIPGELPDLVNLPEGCIFANRCPEVMPKCRSNTPAEYRVGEVQKARCFLVEKEEQP